MNDQPITGINKEWAQQNLTEKGKKKGIDILKIPDDASIPQVEEPTVLFKNSDSVMGVRVPKDEPNRLIIEYHGKDVGEIYFKDNMMFFKGNMDESAMALLFAVKRYVNNWLKLRDDK